MSNWAPPLWPPCPCLQWSNHSVKSDCENTICCNRIWLSPKYYTACSILIISKYPSLLLISSIQRNENIFTKLSTPTLKFLPRNWPYHSSCSQEHHLAKNSILAVAKNSPRYNMWEKNLNSSLYASELKDSIHLDLPGPRTVKTARQDGITVASSSPCWKSLAVSILVFLSTSNTVSSRSHELWSINMKWHISTFSEVFISNKSWHYKIKSNNILVSEPIY